MSLPMRKLDSEYEEVVGGIYDRVVFHRRVGEDLIETATRLIVHEALDHTCGEQKSAAALIARRTCVSKRDKSSGLSESTR